jgi:hypothetical protein
LSPLRLPVPPSRLFVEVIDFTACYLFLFFLSPKQHMRNCVTKCAAFRGFAQPTLILPTKCCDSFSGSDADDQVLKGAPVRDSTTIVSESDLARQLNRSVRTPSTVSRRVGRLATHQNLAAFRIDSVHAWLAQKERKPAANVPLFWPTAQTSFLETVNVQYETNLPSRANFRFARHPGRTQEILAARALFNESPTYRSVADGSSIGLSPWCSNSFSLRSK